ncbi:hypothetical protein DFH11DRAFT_1605151 [Phellopilus nigrolimitatus]|nr:hypothetical protein DFH11DRAFT_1605151 [Phellopilus nigrolimitatus]
MRKRDSHNKLRLYVIFQHRNRYSGFHWALQLAPKSENTSEKGPTALYDATNSLDVGYVDGRWRYRERRNVNVLQLGNVVARILIAKLPTLRKESDKDWTAYLDEHLERVMVVQDDPAWTCRVWVKHAIDALRALVGEFASIPEADVLESEGIPFAEASLKSLLNGEVIIKAHSDIPMKDMRNHAQS